MLKYLNINNLLRDKDLILNQIGDNFTLKLLIIYRFDVIQKHPNIYNRFYNDYHWFADEGVFIGSVKRLLKKQSIENHLKKTILDIYLNKKHNISIDFLPLDKTDYFLLEFPKSEILEYKISFFMLERWYKLNKNESKF